MEITTNQLAPFEINYQQILADYDLFMVKQVLKDQHYLSPRIFNINIDHDNQLPIKAITGIKGKMTRNYEGRLYYLFLIAKKGTVDVNALQQGLEKYDDRILRVEKMTLDELKEINRYQLVKLFFMLLPYYGIAGTGMLRCLYLKPAKVRLKERQYLDLDSLDISSNGIVSIMTSRFTKTSSFNKKGVSLFSNQKRKSLNRQPWFEIDLKHWRICQVKKEKRKINVASYFVHAPLFHYDKPEIRSFWKDGQLTAVQQTKSYLLYELLAAFNKYFSNYFSPLSFKVVKQSQKLTLPISQVRFGEWLDESVANYFAGQTINLVDARVEKTGATIEELKAEVSRLFISQQVDVKVQIKTKLVDEDGFNLVFINEKSVYKQKELPDPYLSYYQNAIVQHLTNEQYQSKRGRTSMLANSLKELVVKDDLMYQRVTLIPDSVSLPIGWNFYYRQQLSNQSEKVFKLVMGENRQFTIQNVTLDGKENPFLQLKGLKPDYIVETPTGRFYSLKRTAVYTLPNQSWYADLTESVAHRRCSRITCINLKQTLMKACQLFPNYTVQYSKLLSFLDQRLQAQFSIQELEAVIDKFKENRQLSLRAVNSWLDILRQEQGLILSVKPRQKAHVQDYLSGLTDINYFTGDDDAITIYYNVGVIAQNMNNSLPRASHLWELKPLFLGKSQIKKVESQKVLEVLRLTMVNFVRYRQLTVIPFPFKYLREFAKLDQTGLLG